MYFVFALVGIESEVVIEKKNKSFGKKSHKKYEKYLFLPVGVQEVRRNRMRSFETMISFSFLQTINSIVQ